MLLLNLLNLFYIDQLSKALDLKPHMMISESMWIESQQRQSPSVARVTIAFILNWVNQIVVPALHCCKSNSLFPIYVTWSSETGLVSHPELHNTWPYTQGRQAPRACSLITMILLYLTFYLPSYVRLPAIYTFSNYYMECVTNYLWTYPQSLSYKACLVHIISFNVFCIILQSLVISYRHRS